LIAGIAEASQQQSRGIWRYQPDCGRAQADYTVECGRSGGERQCGYGAECAGG